MCGVGDRTNCDWLFFVVIYTKINLLFLSHLLQRMTLQRLPKCIILVSMKPLFREESVRQNLLVFSLNTANMDVSYTAILASTPSSKKQCHGVRYTDSWSSFTTLLFTVVSLCMFSCSYCLSAHDSSLDARLMKIQQRCLASERASNCSTANTPRVDRRRKRRRSQELQSSSMGQEEKEKAESVIEAPQVRSKSRFLSRMRTTPKKVHPLKATKSPVIKLSKGKQLAIARSRPVGNAREAGKKGIVRKENSGLSCEVSSSTGKEFSIPVLNVGVCKPEPGTTLESVTHSQQEDDFACNSASLPQDMMTHTADGEQGVNPMAVQTEAAVALAAEKPCSSGTLLTLPVTQASGVRRSPRKNKWKIESSATDDGESSSTQEEERPGTLKREKRSQRHKKVRIVIAGTDLPTQQLIWPI